MRVLPRCRTIGDEMSRESDQHRLNRHMVEGRRNLSREIMKSLMTSAQGQPSQSRCPECDLKIATSADHEACPAGCMCGCCTSLCWRDFGACTGTKVDWRSRAIAAEAELARLRESPPVKGPGPAGVCGKCGENSARYVDVDGDLVCGICPIKAGIDSIRITDIPDLIRDSRVIKSVTPGLYTVAQMYAQHQDVAHRRALDRAALRFAATKVRKSGEAGSEIWAAFLELGDP